MMSKQKDVQRVFGKRFLIIVGIGVIGLAVACTIGNQANKKVAAEKQAFLSFLSCFPKQSLPLTIPQDRQKPLRQTALGLKQIPEDLADTYLAANSSTFIAGEIENADHPIHGYFNFPEFKNVPYYAYARLDEVDGWIPVIFCLNNHASIYFGLAVFSPDGRFKDQVFIAGQEGGSGNLYHLDAELDKKLGVALNFKHSAEHRVSNVSKFKEIYSVAQNIAFEADGAFRARGFHSLKEQPLE